jgi:hypothetical protein
LLEGTYAIAQGSGAFEFEILGGGAHLRFELSDGLQQFVFAGNFADDGIFSGHRKVIGFDDSSELHIDGADDRLRRDVVFAVVGFLFRAAAIRFADGLTHGIGHAVRVENCAAFDVTRATAHRLDERRGAAKIAFFIGVEDGDERNLGEVEAFAEQVDADEDIEFAAA